MWEIITHAQVGVGVMNWLYDALLNLVLNDAVILLEKIWILL